MPFKKILRRIFLIPLGIILIIFSLGNRKSVQISLWPEFQVLEVPLFAIILVALFIGIICGAVLSRMSKD